MQIQVFHQLNFVDEVVANVVPLDVCGVILGSPYLYVRDAIFKEERKIV
jgi:hypothetical protein